jgi:hypothetical protein
VAGTGIIEGIAIKLPEKWAYFSYYDYNNLKLNEIKLVDLLSI